jgi:hypothetical protein
MKFYKLSFTLLFFSTLASAQTNFQPGYVINLSGDTTRGAIDYREWSNNPETFKFKSKAGQITNYRTENTTAFGIDKQEHYQRFTVVLSMNEIDIARLPTGYDSTIVTKTVFLRLLTGGKNLTLYSYTDQLKTRYIIKDSHDVMPHELLYHLFYESGNSGTMKTVNRYRTQLLAYVYKYQQGNQQLIAKIQKMGYNQDIVQVVNVINNESKQKTAGVDRLATRFFAGAAYNIAMLKYSGDIPLAANTAGNTSLFPQFTIGIDAFANRNIGKFVTRVELSFVPYHQLKATSPEVTQTVDQQAIILSPNFIYNFYNGSTVKAFIATGANINMNSYRNNVYTVQFTGSPNSYTLPDYISMRKVTLQVPFKAGITVANKFEVYFNYNLPMHINDNINFTGKFTVVKAGVNYLFGKK